MCYFDETCVLLHGARPVHKIISMIKWIRTSKLSIKNSLGHLGRTMPMCYFDETAFFNARVD